MATLILFVLIGLTCVSAADNQTDVVGEEDNIQADEISVNENLISTDSGIDDAVSSGQDDFESLKNVDFEDKLNEDSNQIYVNGSISDNGNGSITNPYNNLRAAFENADDGYVINIAPGTYFGSDNVGLTINKKLTLTNWTIGDVIIDGQKSSRIFTIEANELNITGLTFINGYAEYGAGLLIRQGLYNSVINASFFNNTAGDGRGGAINSGRNSPLENVTLAGKFIGNVGSAVDIYTAKNLKILADFENNNAKDKCSYGAVAIWDSSFNVTVIGNYINNTADEVGGALGFFGPIYGGYIEGNFTDNNAWYGGGAIYGNFHNAIIKGNFINNSVQKRNSWDHNGYGGACNVYLVDSSVEGVFINNFAYGYGGALDIAGMNKTIRATFINNTAGKDGGAISSKYTYPDQFHIATVVDSIFINNTANEGHGGAIFSTTEIQINNSVFKENTVIGDECNGGALYLKANSTIENSNFTTNSVEGQISCGGAIYFVGEGNVINCLFNDNSATQYGGAVYFNTNGTVKGSKFNKNYGNVYGGAVYFNEEGTVDLSNFTDNVALYGGGVYFRGNGSISNSNFDHNTYSKQGGGVYFNITGSVENSIFTDNAASSGGGAIYFNMNATVIGSNFTNNRAEVGGAIEFNEVMASVEGSNFKNNTASFEGGAIFVLGSNFTVNNSNFNGNQAQSGAGAISVSSDAIAAAVKNSNFTNNHANSNYGGAIKFNIEAIVEGSNFKNNTANAPGGAIAFVDCKGTVKGSNFTENRAVMSGAIYFGLSGAVENSNFNENKVESSIAGAIFFNYLGTVKGSNFTKNTATAGGAVYFSSEGNVSDSCFESNSARTGPGGAVFFSSKGNVTGSNFTKNTAKGAQGGAIIFNGESAVLSSYFESNEAYDAGGAIIFNDRGTVDSCNFINNKLNVIGSSAGGAIFYRAVGIAKDSNFTNNEAINGGAIALACPDSAAAANNKITNCYFTNNKARTGGAVHIESDGKIEYSSFDNNTADNEGGAIRASNVKVNNTNFTNNSAKSGGAIYCDGVINVDLSKFIFNEASDRGGAITLEFNGLISNSMFQNNKAGCYDLAGVVSSGNCPIINMTFEGNERFMNAIWADQVSLSNNTYWNGSMVNSDDVTPIRDARPGINITVEVYDSNSKLVDNVTLVTNNASQVVYSAVKLDAGNYKLKAYHIEDNYYAAVKSKEISFTVVKNSTLVTIKIDDNANFTYGNCNISFEVINRTTVRVVITNKTGEVLVNETTDENFTIVDLLPGEYNITVYNEANELYSSSNDSKLFTIWKVNSTIVILPFEDPIYGNEFEITFGGNNITSINATIYDKDNNIVFTEILEEYIAHIPVLPAGQYTLVAINRGSETINESRNSTTFNILKAANSVNITVENVVEGCAVTINVTAEADGNYTLDINGRIENVTVTGGKGNLTLLLPAGSYYVNATFNPNYDSNITNATFRVLKTMIEAGDAKYGLNDKYTYQAKLVDEDGNPVSNRTLNFTINGKTINATTDNQGIAKITFNVAIGTYDMVVSNNLTDNVTVKVTVLPRIVENKNLVMDYEGDNFRVRALGDDGNPIANEIVQMTVNGKTYNVKTDKNGYATLPIELKPKTYTVTSSYNGTTVKNTLKVKFTLKAKKTVKIKKTAKKLILKATLKWSNGKAIAGKKVTFKFKGKTYKVKTNKKGIAQKVLKKKVIKKLKKGKTYKAKISYKDEIVYTKVKVKR